MKDDEIEKLDPDILTLCVGCSKDRSLKQFVADHAARNVRCGICLQKTEKTNTCSPKHRPALVNLIRSLVRFYYDEDTYNPHWGGVDEPSALLQQDNPIIEDKSSGAHLRSKERSWAFLESVFSNVPYPPYDEGVSVYAGHDDGQRMMHQSIPRGGSPILRRFEARLKKENHFTLEPDVATVIGKVAERIVLNVHSETVYYRARIGYAARFYHWDGGDGEVRYKPFQSGDLGAPPPQLARAGRLNRTGVAFLYLASDADTACAEVRPHPGHIVSIGQYKVAQSLRLANLDADIAAFSASDSQLDLFKFVYAADEAMSMPVIPEEASRYTITQLLAEVLRQSGFQGVAFRSSVSKGRNVCIFSPSDCEFVDASATARRISSVAYGFEAVPTAIPDDPSDYQLK